MGDLILLIAGARPNFMKLAPVRVALDKKFDNVEVVHTGQHYDYEMSQVFFEDLGIPEPDSYLGVGSGSHASQTAKIMIQFEKICIERLPKLVVVFGDVNSTIACSLVAAKMGIPVAHVEAGLRSGDMSMPEEINRIVTDNLSSLLFTTTEYASDNLSAEGFDKNKVKLVGNVMIDTLINQTKKIDNSKIIEKMGLIPNSYNLITLHRPANVDFQNQVERLLSKISRIDTNKRWIFPAHPRTLARLNEFDMRNKYGNIAIIDPLGYNDFSNLLKNSNSIWTDSGGIQEECTHYSVPCFTLRENTERPETVTDGSNILVSVGDDFEKLYETTKNRITYPNIPLWDGKSSERISEIIEEFVKKSR